MRCLVCTKKCIGDYCFQHKPRKPLQTKTRLNPIGKQGRKTAAAVAKWKQTQKPNHQGYYVCFYCGAWVEYLEAEHKNSKARRPDQRTDLTNLVPTCSPCNEKKRSVDGGTFIQSRRSDSTNNPLAY